MGDKHETRAQFEKRLDRTARNLPESSPYLKICTYFQHLTQSFSSQRNETNKANRNGTKECCLNVFSQNANPTKATGTTSSHKGQGRAKAPRQPATKTQQDVRANVCRQAATKTQQDVRAKAYVRTRALSPA